MIYYSHKFQNILFLILLLIFLIIQKEISSSKINPKNKTQNKLENFLEINTKISVTTNQLFSKLNLSPVQAFLETISLHSDISFCIKPVVGKPEKYRSYSCPSNMKIHDDALTVCQKDCPKGTIKGIQNCEEICKPGYEKLNNQCVNNSNSKKYQVKISQILKSDPICVNGYFLNGYCNSCMGHTDYSNGLCLAPCAQGAPSESFCAFQDDSNKGLSVISNYWADFIRTFYGDLFALFNSGSLKRDVYLNAKSLNDVADFIRKNKTDNKVKNDCGKIMIFLRDKLGVNIHDAKQFLRNIFFKMFSRYAPENKENSNDILNVVDDLINFNGDYKSPYLDTKQYGIVSLPLTVANLIEHLCNKKTEEK